MEIKALKCIKCGSVEAVKNGFVNGWQRYKCKKCGYQYTKQSPQGQSIFVQILASTLFLVGFTKREIARIVGVSAMSIGRWIRKYHFYYLTSIAPMENRRILNKAEVEQIFKNSPSEEMLVISRTLPSGAQIDVVIHQIPFKKYH